MKKMFFITSVLMLILGLFITETAHAQNQKKCISEMDQKILNTFEPREETELYLNTRKCVVTEPRYQAQQWVRVIDGALTVIRLFTGNTGQNVVSVWKSNTDPDALGNLPDYEIPVAKKVWDVQTQETAFAFIIFYKTFNEHGVVETVEIDIP
jgi:hypothetical protein